MDFNYSKQSVELLEKLTKFYDEHIYPNETSYDKAIEDSGDPLHIPDVLDDLKEEAKKLDLWNLFLPDKKIKEIDEKVISKEKEIMTI